MIEPANSGLRIALFVALALSLLALQYFNYLTEDVCIFNSGFNM